MPFEVYAAPGGAERRVLVIMFPGYGDTGDDFETHGFIDIMRQHGIDADVLALDAHIGYYASRTLLDVMHDEVLTPERRRQYCQLWLVGISMGGLGALLTAQQFSDVDGVLLLSPYLGESGPIRAIDKAESLDIWAKTASSDDYTTALWRWIATALTSNDGPTIVLGVGEEERARHHEVLSRALPPENVYVVPGRHRWTTWKPLWEEWMKTHVIPNECSDHMSEAKIEAVEK